jgi:hypothetical protein
VSVSLIAYLVAFALFLIACFPAPKSWYVPLGLALFVLGHIIAGVSLKAV